MGVSIKLLKCVRNYITWNANAKLYSIGNCFTLCSAISYYLQVCVIMYFYADIVLL